MATYDPKQLLADYAAGRITPEMAVGHSLQHIAQLYEAQATARTAWQTHRAAVDGHVNRLQVAVDSLTAFMDKLLHKPKPRATPSSSKPTQA